METSTSTQKLAPAFAWLFAAAAVVLGFGSGYLTSGMGWKVSSAVFFGIFFIGGAAATYATRAKTGMAILAFILAAVVVAAAYYLVIAHIASTAANAVGADAQGKQAASTMGNIMGSFVAVIAFIDTLIAGIAGCIVGGKLKNRPVVAFAR
jgi:hypothetical protein